VIVDGTVMQAEQLRPKPAPDSVLEACARLGLPPAEVATFETTAAGVAAGRAAGVERVVLVRREGVGASADRQADRVVADLGELIAVDLA
jgi:beta-phosphoglucomutase-like phosphatase (HAD superfamily)